MVSLDWEKIGVNKKKPKKVIINFVKLQCWIKRGVCGGGEIKRGVCGVCRGGEIKRGVCGVCRGGEMKHGVCGVCRGGEMKRGVCGVRGGGAIIDSRCNGFG